MHNQNITAKMHNQNITAKMHIQNITAKMHIQNTTAKMQNQNITAKMVWTYGKGRQTTEEDIRMDAKTTEKIKKSKVTWTKTIVSETMKE